MTTGSTDRANERASPRTGAPRWSLVVLSLVHAPVFGVAARVLPWRPFTLFALGAYAVAAAHTAVFALALVGNARRTTALRVAAWLSLAFLAAITYATLSSALYVANLYDGVGVPLAGAIAAAWCVVALFTLPFGIFGVATSSPRPRAPSLPLAGALLVTLVLFVLATRASAARGEAVLTSRPSEEDIRAVLAARLGNLTRPLVMRRSLFAAAPARCEAAPAPDRVTVLATYLTPTEKPKSTCAQASTLDGAASALASVLTDDYGGGPVAIDVVTRRQRLDDLGPLLGPLALRPAADGVCLGARCLAPFQLVGLDQFTKAAALATFDVKVGVSPASLRAALGAPSDEGLAGLTRIATASFVLMPNGSVEPLERLARRAPIPSSPSLRAAVTAAGDFILSAQEGDGRFRYTTDPFTGATSMTGFGVPRQAGTTLALCDAAGLVPGAKPVAIRSLDMLSALEERDGDVSGIGGRPSDASPAWLGSSALTMAALLGCRDLVGDRYDALIDRLGHGLLGAERADGSFAPRLDVANNAPVAGKLQLYAGGQAILALVGWEAAKGGDLHPPSDLGSRIDAAMDYISGPYWKGPLYDVFFLEENWHCIAARDALPSHRRDSYERFCLDYVEMKKKLLIEPGDADAYFVGGFGFGTLIPPHDAATGGFGETLAAAIDIERARGVDTTDDDARLRSVLAYLLRRQWSDDRSIFMTDRVRVAGAFSENIGSPTVRIDFVQHALEALAHGGATLGMLANTELRPSP